MAVFFLFRELRSFIVLLAQTHVVHDHIGGLRRRTGCSRRLPPVTALRYSYRISVAVAVTFCLEFIPSVLLELITVTRDSQRLFYFGRVIKAALRSRYANIIFLPCGFFLSFFLSFFIPRLISAVGDCMSTILRYMV